MLCCAIAIVIAGTPAGSAAQPIVARWAPGVDGGREDAGVGEPDVAPRPGAPDQTARPAQNAAASQDAPRPRAPGALRSWPVAIIFANGQSRIVDLISLRLGDAGGEIALIESDGTRRTVSASLVAAIAHPSWIDADREGASPAFGAAGTSVLELVDGQRLPGEFATPSDPGRTAPPDVIEWSHARFGRWSVPLDDVRRWWRNASEAALADLRRVRALVSTDRVELNNADVLSGVIEEVAPRIVLGGARRNETSWSFEPSAVFSVDLSNPARTPSGMLAWLADGSIVSLASLASESDGGRLRARAKSEDLQHKGGREGAYILPSELVALAIDASRLSALSALKVVNVEPAPPRAFARPPRTLFENDGVGPAALGAHDVLIDGASIVEFSSPGAASPGTSSPGGDAPGRSGQPGPRTFRMVGVAELAPDARTWGELTLVIGVSRAGGNGSDAIRIPLSGSRFSAPINVELEARAEDRIRISVLPGPLGPVHNRVILRRVLLHERPR